MGLATKSVSGKEMEGTRRGSGGMESQGENEGKRGGRGAMDKGDAKTYEVVLQRRASEKETKRGGNASEGGRELGSIVFDSVSFVDCDRVEEERFGEEGLRNRNRASAFRVCSLWVSDLGNLNEERERQT